MENTSAATQPHANRWLVIFGTALVQIAVGSFYAWAIFNNGFQLISGGELNKVTGKIVGGLPAGSVSFTFTIGMLFLALGTLIGIPLSKRFGIKIVGIVSAILYGLSIMGLTLVGKGSSIWLLWLFGGVLLGLLDGLLYMMTLTNAIKWFPERKGLISGISVACYGLGSLIFKYIDQGIAGGSGKAWGKITDLNIDHVLLWWGIIALVFALVGSFFLKDAPVEDAPAGAAVSDKENFTAPEMLKTSQAYMIFFTLVTASMFMGLLGAAVTNIAALGTQPADKVITWGGLPAAAMFVAVVAVLNTLGRFIMGTLSDYIGRKGVFFITFTIQLVALAALLFTKPGTMSMTMMYVVIGAMAFCFGGNITVFPTFVADYYGIKNSARNYSIIYQGFGVGALVVGFLMASGNPLNPAKVAYSDGAVLTQNFTLSYWVLLIMVILSLIIFLVIRKPEKR